MPEHPPLDGEIRALYHGPPAGFTAARLALAKRLRQAGDPRHSEVRGLAKPPLSAWAVNRLFAEEPGAMAELVGAGERARAAQERPGGDAAELRELVAAIRSGIERLTARGAEILAAEAGRAPGEAIVERLRTDLQALALDPGAAAVAARGWLDADLEPPGFEHLAALTVAATADRPRAAPPPAATPAPALAAGPATVHSLDAARSAAAERTEYRERERRQRERRERIERAREAAAGAEAEAASAHRTAEEARHAAERAAEAAAEAERRAAAARETSLTARRAASDAEARAALAGKAAARAREELARAERS